jgi:hypothetical protein
LLTRILKYLAAGGCGLLSILFICLAMAFSSGVAGLPGVWIMQMGNHPMVHAIGFVVGIGLVITSLGIPTLCAMASIHGYSQCITWANGGQRPSIHDCLEEASRTLGDGVTI